MATENLHSAPIAPITAAAPEIPADILKRIKHAWVAALFSAGITLAVTLIAMSGTELLGYSAWELIDVVFILGLAFGIYKKSRTCAVLMFVYFIISKIILMMEAGKPTGIPLALLFIYFYWQGVSGTFAFHKLKNRALVPAASGG